MDVIKLVQVSDFVVGTHDTPNRVVPGDGDIPLRRVLGDIITAGYDGSFDLELIGPRVEEEGYESAVRRAIDATSALLDSLSG
jgi:sugar phosphate isomerase/epimerase